MIKRIFILGIILSLIQTFVYFIFVKLLQFAETKFAAENYLPGFCFHYRRYFY